MPLGKPVSTLAQIEQTEYIALMINMLKRLIGGGSDEPRDRENGRVALAALLVEAANADGDYDADERSRITRILATRYQISEPEAAALRAEGEAAQSSAVDLVRFTRAVKDSVPHDERVAVLEAVWEVIYADGVREMHENALIRKLCGLLHIEDRDAGLARQRVAARLGVE